jgi:hypothetical protein
MEIDRQFDLLSRPGYSLRGVGMFPIRFLVKRKFPGLGIHVPTWDTYGIPIQIVGKSSIRWDDQNRRSRRVNLGRNVRYPTQLSRSMQLGNLHFRL